jgi:hypothetical protein
MLAVSIILFASGISVWISAAAAFSAGVAALLTGAIIQTWLVQANSGNTASVMALWAIAWAGTKPIASLADGWLANSINVRAAGVILAMPALILALFEISLPDARKQKIKAVGKKYTTMIWEAALPQDAGFASPDN